MSGQHISTYLNDHLAGAATGLEMLDHLEMTYAGTDLARDLIRLHAEIAEDRQELQKIMQRLGVAESQPRQAAAWIAEKVAELKLRLEDEPRGALHQLEGLEAVAVGIDGKKALWQALGAVAPNVPGLEEFDFGRLEQRAVDQRGRIEVWRLEAARAALP